MKEIDVPNDRTLLMSPSHVSRHISNENQNGLASHPKKFITKYMATFITVAGLERFTYYSIVVNLFLFFNDNVFQEKDSKGHDHIPAVVSVMVLIGVSWLFCVLGGWVSDVKLGRLKTVIWGLVIYTLGTGCLVVSAYCIRHYLKDKPAFYRALIVFASLLIVAIGEGAVKANIAVFGADQFDVKDSLTTRRYFNLYYFSISTGILLAMSVTAYIQQWKGFHIGFAIPLASISLALLVLVLSRKRYKTLPCQQIVGKVVQIVKEARRNYKRSGKGNSPMTIQQKVAWLDHARMKYGGSFLDWEVDEVKFLFAVIPLFIVLLPYATIFHQIGSTFLQQGVHMKLPVPFNNSDNFPAAWLQFFNAATTVILLPIMDRLVYPWLTKQGYRMALLTRISIGIMVACFAVIAAGFVEIWVVKDFINGHTVINQNVNEGRNVTAANLSVFYQLPQYFLIGVGEVFASVGSLEFAYRNAPRSMQGLVMALFFVTNSLGLLLGSGLLELSRITGLICEKGKGHKKKMDLTYYFFLLSGLGLLSWIVFIIYFERNRRKRSKLPRTCLFNTRGSSIGPGLSTNVRSEN